MSTTNPPQLPPDLDLPPAALPAWPKVIGIISICLASLGLFCGVCGVGWAQFAPSMMPADQRSQFPPSFISPLQLVGTGLAVPNSVLLLIAGIMTLKRKRIGRSLHLVYALLAFPLVALGIYAQFDQQAVLAKWVRENPGTTFAKSQQGIAGNIGPLVGMVMSFLFGLGYPIFLIIWFGVVKAKADMGTPKKDYI